MPTTYGNDIVYCLKSHCGVRGYCRQKWVLQVQIICKFSNERTCKRNKDVQGLSCGFEVLFLICLYIVNFAPSYMFNPSSVAIHTIPCLSWYKQLMLLFDNSLSTVNSLPDCAQDTIGSKQIKKQNIFFMVVGRICFFIQKSTYKPLLPL